MDWIAYYRELDQSDRDPTTTARYKQIADTYRKWLGDRQPDVANAKEFIAHLRDEGYTPNAVLLYYHGLRPLFDFIGQPLKIKLRKTLVLPGYYDKGDIETLITQAERGLYHETEKQKRRNKALVLVLAYTGMRKSELLNLLVSHIDFNEYRILVKQGKGRRDRVIPMHQRLITCLREQCSGKTAQEKAFDGLNARSVYRIVTSLARACGLQGFHPHSLRHYFASRLVESGADLRSVQELLGHRSLDTTAIYVQVTAAHLRAALDLLDTPRGQRHQCAIVP
jgi:integrase